MTDLRFGPYGPFAAIDIVMLGWFVLVAASVAYVAWDAWRNNPELKVMKAGWVLVTVYLGPVGLLLYVLSCKEPVPGTHERFVTPLWKQALGSTIHCVAGDATGIIVAAVVTGALGLPMNVDLVIEYVAGFAFGLLIFQALFMKDMMGGSYREAVRRTILPEWLSMNFMMAGMFPPMVLLMMGQDMRAMEPTQPLFWGTMSVAVLVGLVTAYPVNLWMVLKGLKHGMGTERALGKGGQPVAMDVGMKGSAAGKGGHDMGAMEMHGGKMSAAATRDANGRMDPKGTPTPDDAFRVTRPQLTSVALTSVLALVAGVLIPGSVANLSLGARDVGGAIMPPGMIMRPDSPGEAMRDMAAVDHTKIVYRAPTDARGDQPLEPVIEGSIKVFRLEASVIEWNILDDEPVLAYAFNGQVPGPRIRVTQGDTVRIEVTNRLPESTTVHWHGLIVPNRFDGPADITQAPIPSGGSFTYEFTITQAGTFFYHSHDHADRQQALGLYGALIVDPRDPLSEPQSDQEVVIQLQEWLERDGYTYPAMPMEGGMPNFFTINGKAWPATERISARVGDRIRFRFIGSNSGFIHPMHIHGGPFEIISTDGSPVPEGAVFEKDTLNVAPGERYDAIWTARQPGTWILHCHINHHTTNDNVEEQGAGGLTMAIDVAP
ncbi:MAG: multicopper oxidase domain-containing protein [Candidatus Limnocylindrales bacterium]